MKAIVMNSAGGREMLKYVERPDPVTGPGQALVEVAVAGVNFMDIGVRRGTLGTDVPNPKVLGVEGMGRVLAVGDGVEDIEPGQRVAWVYAPGSYAERIAIPATSLNPGPLDIMKLPKSIKIGYAGFRDHIHTPELFRAHSAQLFDWISEGKLKILVGGEYRLADAAKAHADMESRKTVGKLVLVP